MFDPMTTLAMVFALGGPPIIALYGTRLSAQPMALSSGLICQGLMIGLVVAVLALAFAPSQLSFASIGLRVPDGSTLLWAAGMAGVFILALGPLLMRLPHWLGLAGFEGGLAQLARLPVWYLVLAVIVGGIAEEILYRGVGLTLLSSTLGSPWAAAPVIILLFGLAHLPLWGPGPALTTMISGAALMAFFLLHGDLVANMLAHIATDAVGIVLGPLRSALKQKS